MIIEAVPRRSIWVLGAFALFAVLLRLAAPPSLHTMRVRDFAAVADALERYHRDHGSYPVASFVSNFATGVRRNDWIPGLSPYLARLPEDPRGSEKPNLQYLYNSDGRDFKFIAHAPEDFNPVARAFPALVDPRRPTWAYGIWTPGASTW